jgi:hypothetical protein
MSDARNYSRPLGSEQVVQHFGYWPTFHDGELLSFMLDSDPGRGEFGPTAIITLRMVEPSAETVSGDFSRKGCVITFAFYDIGMKKIEGQRKHGAVPGMSLVEVRGSDFPRFTLAMKLQGAHGLTCSFQCRLAEVIDFKPVMLPASVRTEADDVPERETA